MADEDKLLTNRERRQRPKYDRGWCGGCDAWFLTAHKCPICGRKSKTKRLKKDTNA